MSAPFQILPHLATDDLRRLKASILEHGIEVPIVVDEDGNIIDGHHRAMIADSLGIEYPKVVRVGLNQSEKRILAAELNIARRHMTDAQKVKLGQDIEPDIAAIAKARSVANLKNQSSVTGVTLDKTVSRTTDEVARTVGIGSGRTYERGKEVLDQLRNEPDGERLIQYIDDGDWTLDDARTELRTRHPQRREPDPIPRTFEPAPLFTGGPMKPTPIVETAASLPPDTAALRVRALREILTADANDAASYLVDMDRNADDLLNDLPALIAWMERFRIRLTHHLDRSGKRSA